MQRIMGMEIADLITPRSVIANLRATSKKQALQELAKRAAATAGLEERRVYDVLTERERLGTTGIGMGIGIPHGKLPELTTLYGIFARLERPIPFEAIDDQPVDLVFMLLAPENAGADHLKALACVSRRLRDRAVCEKLRGTDSADALYALLTDRAASLTG
jgi:PTS system nitrogen regulatory IIA component